jgi:hypothetical protein
MTDLPDLPPGWVWDAVADFRVARPPWGHRDVSMTPYGLVVPPGVDPATVAGRAWGWHRGTLTATVRAIAEREGAALPDDVDPGAVIAAGVRAVTGWTWDTHPVTGSEDLLLEHRGRWVGEVIHDDDGWYSGIVEGDEFVCEGAPTREAAARALRDAVGPEGVPMPPLTDDS